MTHPIPDIFLLGAQKSGTTSLAVALEKLDGVCLSRPKEPMLISRDEVELHPHYFANTPEAWENWNIDARPELLADAYAKCFSHAGERDLRCDASTSYLPSMRSPERIRALNPRAKFVIILRDPAKRAHSNWWHHIKNGISCETFAGHLQFEHSMTMRSGEYAGHIKRWLEVFPRRQFLFLIYEQVLENPQAALDAFCRFADIPPQAVSLPARNRNQPVKSLRAQLWINRLRRRLNAGHSAIHKRTGLVPDLLAKLDKWNRGNKTRPKMDAGLHRRLDTHYRRANAELEGLTGLDVTPYWYKAAK